jgi:hypothetical protein
MGYGARLGDLWLRLATSRDVPLRIYTQDSLAGREADQSSSYENVLDIGHDFARSDFSGGEGLGWFPRPIKGEREEQDSTRFYDSANIAIERGSGGKPGELTLAPATELWWDSAGGSGAIKQMAASNTHLYVAVDDVVNRFDSWGDSSPDSSPSVVTNVSRLIIDPADNGLLHVVTSGDVYAKEPASATWSKLTNTASALDNIANFWFAKGRIIATKQLSNGIWEMGELTYDAATLATTWAVFDTLKAQPLECIDAEIAILVSYEDGTIRSYVPQTDTAGGTVELTVRGITPMPRNEVAYGMAVNLGVLLILTQEPNDSGLTGRSHVRAYNAAVLDERFDFIVGQLQLVREWRDTFVSSSVLGPQRSRSPVTGREAFYWVIEEHEDDTTGSNIWTQDLVTKGVSRYFNDPVPLSDHGIDYFLYWRDRFLWTRPFAAEVWRTADTYQDVGWLITPNINFGLNTIINWASTTIHALGIVGGAGIQVELLVSTDPTAIDDWEHASWRLVSRLNDPYDGGIENPLLDIDGSSLAMQLRLYSTSANAVTPTVTRTSVRGLPSHRDFIVELPISISDYIEVPGRRNQRIAGYGNEIHGALLDMQGKHYELEVVQPPLFMRGIVDVSAEPVSYISDRGSVGKVMLVRFRGTYVSAGQTGQTTGNETMGLGLMGRAIMGRGQSGVT